MNNSGVSSKRFGNNIIKRVHGKSDHDDSHDSRKGGGNNGGQSGEQQSSEQPPEKGIDDLHKLNAHHKKPIIDVIPGRALLHKMELLKRYRSLQDGEQSRNKTVSYLLRFKFELSKL
ncbi:hypothetical protein DID77_01060 [Candidatus Marinamargulisbacteria bacterium SCGC AG-439-L15]|nr:hypothetical protein DID77_01060 [Candidatus Marinamargulisbacteria bacterium SCGC AG-439-L15]